MNKEFKEWVDTRYNPWKEAMKDYENSKVDVQAVVQKNAAELKYIVSLLLEKREAEAVKIWNDLGLKPQLVAINLNVSKDELSLVKINEEVVHLSISGLLEELQEMLDA